VFNLSGSEIIVILLLALVVLGPEKLPDAMRRAGRAYSELRKMATSFQSEVRSVIEEPMNEMRETADMLREATKFGEDTSPTQPSSPAPVAPSTPAPESVEPVETVAPVEPVPAGGAAPSNDTDETDHLITRTLSGDADPAPPDGTTTT
jgi:sec-independent protein translocase protein TatB